MGRIGLDKGSTKFKDSLYPAIFVLVATAIVLSSVIADVVSKNLLAPYSQNVVTLSLLTVSLFVAALLDVHVRGYME
jgi:hypothetical protein